MKLNQLKPTLRHNPLRRLIQRATGAPTSDLALIENIMREDIYHSTLDWQTRQQLEDASRKAFSLLATNRGLYELGRASALAVFPQMRASPTN